MDVQDLNVGQTGPETSQPLSSELQSDIESLFHRGVKYKEIARLVNSKPGIKMT